MSTLQDAFNAALRDAIQSMPKGLIDGANRPAGALDRCAVVMSGSPSGITDTTTFGHYRHHYLSPLPRFPVTVSLPKHLLH